MMNEMQVQPQEYVKFILQGPQNALFSEQEMQNV
jgi:hypothetical protein